jgi:hypothetical protein
MGVCVLEEVKKSLGQGLPDLLDAHSGPGFTRHLYPSLLRSVRANWDRTLQ